jgi:hypothetical protein
MFDFLFVDFDFHLVPLFGLLKLAVFDAALGPAFFQLFGRHIPERAQPVTLKLVVISLFSLTSQLQCKKIRLFTKSLKALSRTIQVIMRVRRPE